MKALIILNDPPYGTERSYNGLRLALALAKTDGTELRLFLMGRCGGLCEARPEDGGRLLQPRAHAARVSRKGGPGRACGTCMDARGLVDADLVAGAHRSSMTELAEWTLWAEKVLTF